MVFARAILHSSSCLSAWHACLRALHGRGMRTSFFCANSHARTSRGANVVVNYAGSKDAAEAVAKEIEGMGVKAMAVKVCLSPTDSLPTFFPTFSPPFSIHQIIHLNTTRQRMRSTRPLISNKTNEMTTTQATFIM